MKMNGRKWVLTGIVIFIVAAIALYIPYNNEIKKQDDLEQNIFTSQQRVLILTMSKGKLEDEITQLEADIAVAQEESAQKQVELDNLQEELDELEHEREQAIIDALVSLNNIKAEYPDMIASIDYSESLFALAETSDIKLNGLITSDTATVVIEGINYEKISIKLSTTGYRDNILKFISGIQSDDAFKTAFFDNIDVSTPLPLTDEEKAAIYTTALNELKLAAISQFTIDEMVDFIILAIEDVTGTHLDTHPVEEIAQNILSDINSLVTEGYDVTFAYDLAELIKQHISEWIIDEFLKPLSDEIAEVITGGGDHATMAALFGEEIASLIGENFTGTLPEDIAELLKSYISSLIDLKMGEAVFPLVEIDALELADSRIAETESSEGDISLVIYYYQEAE
jgi:Skp family chaperone for outer membrane proteins